MPLAIHLRFAWDPLAIRLGRQALGLSLLGGWLASWWRQALGLSLLGGWLASRRRQALGLSRLAGQPSPTGQLRPSACLQQPASQPASRRASRLRPSACLHQLASQPAKRLRSSACPPNQPGEAWSHLRPTWVHRCFGLVRLRFNLRSRFGSRKIDTSFLRFTCDSLAITCDSLAIRLASMKYDSFAIITS